MNDQRFRHVPQQIFRIVQQSIKDDIGRVIDYKYANKVLDGAGKITDLEKIIDYLTKYLNYRIKKYI
jgi:hypothetical protein